MPDPLIVLESGVIDMAFLRVEPDTHILTRVPHRLGDGFIVGTTGFNIIELKHYEQLHFTHGVNSPATI
jgi:hypothetical protein